MMNREVYDYVHEFIKYGSPTGPFFPGSGTHCLDLLKKQAALEGVACFGQLQDSDHCFTDRFYYAERQRLMERVLMLDSDFIEDVLNDIYGD